MCIWGIYFRKHNKHQSFNCFFSIELSFLLIPNFSLSSSLELVLKSLIQLFLVGSLSMNQTESKIYYDYTESQTYFKYK